jgi:hypothetical protein
MTAHAAAPGQDGRWAGALAGISAAMTGPGAGVSGR